MTVSTIDNSQRTAAKVAAISLLFSMSCVSALIIASCAEQPPPPPLHPLIEGAAHSVFGKDIPQAIIVAQQYRLDAHGSPLPVSRVHVIDRSHLDVSFRLPGITEAFDRPECTRGRWQFSGEHTIIAPNLPLS